MTDTITRMNPPQMPDSTRIGYSQISIADPGRLAFVSGQVAWHREDGAVPGTLAEQTAVVLDNLSAALASLGARTEDIVQMRAYMIDLTPDRMAVVMGPLAGFLAGAQPSLTGVGVTALASPDLQLEVEMVVRLPA